MFLASIIVISTGCSSSTPLCDYQNYTSQILQCSDQKDDLHGTNLKLAQENVQFKADNNALKVDYLNNCNRSVAKTYTCDTAVRLLGNCELRLETCWTESNQTIEVINNTPRNETLIKLYDNCTTILRDINESLQ